MGSVPVGVESISDLPFQSRALKGRWPVTPWPPYLRTSKDPVYLITAKWTGRTAETEFPYKFRPGLGLNPEPRRDSIARCPLHHRRKRTP